MKHLYREKRLIWPCVFSWWRQALRFVCAHVMVPFFLRARNKGTVTCCFRFDVATKTPSGAFCLNSAKRPEGRAARDRPGNVKQVTWAQFCDPTDLPGYLRLCCFRSEGNVGRSRAAAARQRQICFQTSSLSLKTTQQVQPLSRKVCLNCQYNQSAKTLRGPFLTVRPMFCGVAVDARCASRISSNFCT